MFVYVCEAKGRELACSVSVAWGYGIFAEQPQSSLAVYALRYGLLCVLCL